MLIISQGKRKAVKRKLALRDDKAANGSCQVLSQAYQVMFPFWTISLSLMSNIHAVHHIVGQ